MKIAIGADHGGYVLKKDLIGELQKRGYEIRDFGTYSQKRCDYPPIGRRVASVVASGKYDRGILICKTGLGMSMAANRVRGVRAALLFDAVGARSSREHNDANIAVFSGNRIGAKKASGILKIWFNTGFLGGRHKRRVRQLDRPGKKSKRGR